MFFSVKQLVYALFLVMTPNVQVLKSLLCFHWTHHVIFKENRLTKLA